MLTKFRLHFITIMISLLVIGCVPSHITPARNIPARKLPTKSADVTHPTTITPKNPTKQVEKYSSLIISLIIYVINLAVVVGIIISTGSDFLKSWSFMGLIIIAITIKNIISWLILAMLSNQYPFKFGGNRGQLTLEEVCLTGIFMGGGGGFVIALFSYIAVVYAILLGVTVTFVAIIGAVLYVVIIGVAYIIVRMYGLTTSIDMHYHLPINNYIDVTIGISFLIATIFLACLLPLLFIMSIQMWGPITIVVCIVHALIEAIINMISYGIYTWSNNFNFFQLDEKQLLHSASNMTNLSTIAPHSWKYTCKTTSYQIIKYCDLCNRSQYYKVC